jgi:hypothetical protein
MRKRRAIFFLSSSQTYIFGVRQGLTIRVGIRKKNQKIKFQEHNTLTFGGNFIYHTQIDDDIRHFKDIGILFIHKNLSSRK